MIPDGITIRELEFADFDNGLFDCLSALSPSPALQEFDRTLACSWRRDAGVRTLVAVTSAGRVIGTASYFWETKFTRNLCLVGHVEDVSVDHGQQGKGVGLALVGEAIRRLRGLPRCRKVILSCSQANVPFYAKLGFQPHEVSMRLDLAAPSHSQEADRAASSRLVQEEGGPGDVRGDPGEPGDDGGWPNSGEEHVP